MIRILTLNTWKCDGSYDQRILAINQQLSELKPDILALQECFVSGSAQANTARAIASHLHMDYTWAPARYKPRLFNGKWVDSYSGLAILTSHQVIKHECIQLPNSIQDGERIAQITTILCNRIPIAIINVHLTHLKDAHDLRVQQLQTLMAHLNEHYNASYYFICGDFNCEPETPPIEFFEHTFQAKHSYHLLTPPSTPQPTIHNKCIDFIYTIPNHDLPYPTCLQSQIVLHKAINNIFPSDHAGVMALFTF